MRFGTSDTNEAKFCTPVDSCAGMNIGNLKLHQEIVESHIQFEDDNPFDPIFLNCALDEEKNNLEETLTSLVAYITGYKNSNKKFILISSGLGKDVTVNSITGRTTLKKWIANIYFNEDLLVSKK